MRYIKFVCTIVLCYSMTTVFGQINKSEKKLTTNVNQSSTTNNNGTAAVVNDDGTKPTSESLTNDINKIFGNLHTAIETEYAKLMTENQANKALLVDQINELNKQIAKLKDQAAKVEDIAAKQDALKKLQTSAQQNSSVGTRLSSEKNNALMTLTQQKQQMQDRVNNLIKQNNIATASTYVRGANVQSSTAVKDSIRSIRARYPRHTNKNRTCNNRREFS